LIKVCPLTLLKIVTNTTRVLWCECNGNPECGLFGSVICCDQIRSRLKKTDFEG